MAKAALSAPAYKRTSLVWDLCREPAADPISEAELSRIWEGQLFPKEALSTPAGEVVEVVFRGRKGGGAGPDFRDAVLRLGGEERRGDVELRVRASYFRGHGHHLDPAYDSVALHVVYLADEGETTRLSNGTSTPIAAFAPWVRQRSADLQQWLEGPPLWREPCAGAVEHLGEQRVRGVLVEAGIERYRAKVKTLRDQIETAGEQEALWCAVVECLGYGGDREGFRRLAIAFPASLARELLLRTNPYSVARLENALLAVAGLAELPPELAGRLPPPLRPSLGGLPVRPANRPERRLEALARLCEQARGELAAYALRTVSEAGNAKELIESWRVPALLGNERAAELVLNAVLPFAAIQPALEEKATALAYQLPVQRSYGKTEFLERNLRRENGRRLVNSAIEQQGLLALLGNWCSQGGCGHCPLS